MTPRLPARCHTREADPAPRPAWPRRLAVVPVSLLLVSLVPHAAAQPLSVSPHALPSGGGVSSSTRFTVAGTIGQALAHSPEPGSERFFARAGFWSHVLRWKNAAPSANPDTVSRRPGEAAHVLIRQLLANDRDPDFDPLALVDFEATTPLGGSVFREGPWLIYQPPPGAAPDAEDTFTYQVTDGFVPSTASVRIGPFIPSASGPPNPLSITLNPGPPAQINVRFQGIPRRSYIVQAAADPAGPWANLASVSASANGQVHFSEPQTSDPRFYRLVEPSP